ncbi:hypothetical protein PROFUN_03626 [Planoprotostelium fungivorum]|uniref:Sphingomyelin synthase-like domain-containing protein n=1 Tax=Planoprotostelium fungivorum TaxID=1890364 RepID=A0A2P6NSM3_9EUKA|nr:hypothetical protein PROFUN_03626 [Planoprotostelium fungivorum]
MNYFVPFEKLCSGRVPVVIYHSSPDENRTDIISGGDTTTYEAFPPRLRAARTFFPPSSDPQRPAQHNLLLLHIFFLSEEQTHSKQQEHSKRSRSILTVRKPIESSGNSWIPPKPTRNEFHRRGTFRRTIHPLEGRMMNQDQVIYEAASSNHATPQLTQLKTPDLKSPYLEIDVASDFFSEDGEDTKVPHMLAFSPTFQWILSVYRYYINNVEQEKTYTAHVNGLSPLASKKETLLWLALYPFRREKPILKYMWVALATFVVCLLIHGWSTRVAYYFHSSGPRLRDLGFLLLPELPPQYKILSELIFNFIFIGTIVMMALHPQRFRLFIRLLFMFSFLYLCRCASFLSTGLPSPALHCHPGAQYYDPPKQLMEIFFKFSTTMGCGDLIFSGHSLHSTTTVLIFTKYVKSIGARVLWWLCLITMYLLIIAARKHYTIDVLIAFYFIPFVFTVYSDRFEPWLFNDVKKRKLKAVKLPGSAVNV